MELSYIDQKARAVFMQQIKPASHLSLSKVMRLILKAQKAAARWCMDDSENMAEGFSRVHLATVSGIENA